MNIFRNKYLSLFDNVEVESDFIGKNSLEFDFIEKAVWS